MQLLLLPPLPLLQPFAVSSFSSLQSFLLSSSDSPAAIVEAVGTEMVHCSSAVVEVVAEVQDFVAEAHEAIEMAADRVDLDQD